MSLHLVLTLAVFGLTLGLMLVRPRRLSEAWAAVGGGALMLALRLETPAQAVATVAQGAGVLVFLLALMLLSLLVDRAGFFEWAALHTAQRARGSGPRLFRNVFLLGAACTAFLSLDTTAILLTPMVLSLVRQLKVRARPYLLACAFVANTASLLLPVSNLTNLLYANALHLSFPRFVLRMAVPQMLVLLANYLLFARMFRQDLAAPWDAAGLPEPRSAIRDVPFFRVALVVLGLVFVGYFVGALVGIPTWAVACAGAGGLLLWGGARRQVTVSLFRDVSWGLFPFVVGLFVVVRGVENLGLAPVGAHGLALLAGHHGPALALGSALGAGLGTNVVNNLPMALVSLEVLRQSPSGPDAVFGSLVGCNLGPNLTLVGSLATMLVISSARRRGEDLRGWDFFRVGAVVTPLLLVLGALAVWAVGAGLGAT